MSINLPFLCGKKSCLILHSRKENILIKFIDLFSTFLHSKIQLYLIVLRLCSKFVVL